MNHIPTFLVSMMGLFFIATATSYANGHEKLSKNSHQLIRLIGENEVTRNFAIHRVIAARCYRYLPWNESRLCSQAAKKMIQELNFDILFLDNKNVIPPFTFLAFKKDLIHLLNDESTGRYLNAIAQQLDLQLYDPRLLINLWDETLEFYNQNSFLAVKSLALLFQDTSDSQAHLEYLARTQVNGSRFFDPNISRLSRVIELLKRLQTERRDIYAALVYPPAVQGLINNNIYHFYVPWYLALTLRDQGIAPRYAKLAPFMLTTSYEFVTSGPDLRYLFKDPARITSDWIFKDIYAGMAGVKMAFDEFDAGRGVDSLSLLFQTSTPNAMAAILKDL